MCLHHFTLQSTWLYTAGSRECPHHFMLKAHICVNTLFHFPLQAHMNVSTPFYTECGSHECVNTIFDFHCRLTWMCPHHFTLRNHTCVNTIFDFHCRLTWTPASWFCVWCWRRERVSCPLSVWPARTVSLTWGWSWTAPRSSLWASLPSATSCASCRYSD